MRYLSPCATVVVLALSCLPVSAQITVFNSAGGATSAYVTATGVSGTTTQGSSITIDNTLARVGLGCASRVPAPANQSFIPCGSGVNPANGFCIQFWIRSSGAQPNTTTNYLFADASMVAPTGFGVFRCYVFWNGPGTLYFRGVSNQFNSSVGIIPPDTWTHVAYKYEPPPSNTLKCLINGSLEAAVAQTATPFTWRGSNLTICGGDNSSATSNAYLMDDIRFYSFARTDADIAADYTVAAAGNGPSGASNLPDRAYFDLDVSVPPHIAKVGSNMDAPNTSARLATGGTLIEWDGDSPAGDLPASCLINVYGPSLGNPAMNPYAFGYRAPPSLPVNYVTPGAPGVELGHGYSVPANPIAVAWPDGLSLALLPGLVFLSVPGPYSYQSSRKHPVFPGRRGRSGIVGGATRR